jgi:hypothetical protein
VAVTVNLYCPPFKPAAFDSVGDRFLRPSPETATRGSIQEHDCPYVILSMHPLKDHEVDWIEDALGIFGPETQPGQPVLAFSHEAWEPPVGTS